LDSEQFVSEYLTRKLKLDPNHFEAYDGFYKNAPTQYDALKDVGNQYYTPDFVISNNNQDSLEDLFFLDVSGPTGSLMKESGIEIDKEISRLQSKLKIGETRSVLLTKQVKVLVDSVRSKLNKINTKYANNRDKSGSKSMNTGVIYCMENPIDSPLTEYASYQLSVTTLELLDLLSEGKCQYLDIEHEGLNRPVCFNFKRAYENIAFVAFVGRGSLENRSYMFVNKKFIHQSKNILASKLHSMGMVDGNKFRTTRIDKDEMYLDFQNVLLDDTSYIFPYGNTNYLGNTIPGVDIKLSTLTLEEHLKVQKEMDDGLKR